CALRGPVAVAPGYFPAGPALPGQRAQQQLVVAGHALDRFQLRAGGTGGRLVHRLLRAALVVGAVSGLSLLGLLAWSTGNASRFAQYYDTLLLLNGILALALFVWVVGLAVRLVRQLRRRQFGARLTARFALAFALIGVLPGAL